MFDNIPANLKIDSWFKAIALLGGVIAVAGLFIPFQVGSNADWVTLGFGMVLLGLGSWKNQKTRTEFISGGMLSWQERKSDPLGLLFEAGGLLLIIGAILRFLSIDIPVF
jgi:hypothetical protein